MSAKERRLSQKEMLKALDLACLYHENYRASYSEIEIKETGAEAEIPEEFIEKAIEEVLKKKKQQQFHQQKFCQILGGIIFCLLIGTIVQKISQKNGIIQQFEPKSQVHQPQKAQYVNGTIRDLELLQEAYLKSQDKEHSQAIATTFLQRVKEIDKNSLPSDLRLFIDSLERKHIKQN